MKYILLYWLHAAFDITNIRTQGSIKSTFTAPYLLSVLTTYVNVD